MISMSNITRIHHFIVRRAAYFDSLIHIIQVQEIAAEYKPSALLTPVANNVFKDMSEHQGNATDLQTLHPIELAAHSLLSGPLDNINEGFHLLSQSQLILLTRLRVVEDRLEGFKKTVCDESSLTNEGQMSICIDKARSLKKRIDDTIRLLKQVEERVKRINDKLLESL